MNKLIILPFLFLGLFYNQASNNLMLTGSCVGVSVLKEHIDVGIGFGTDFHRLVTTIFIDFKVLGDLRYKDFDCGWTIRKDIWNGENYYGFFIEKVFE